MNCINKSHPDYQSLAASGINPMILDARIMAWQKANNTTNFPTLAQIGLTPENLMRLQILDEIWAEFIRKRHSFVTTDVGKVMIAMSDKVKTRPQAFLVAKTLIERVSKKYGGLVRGAIHEPNPYDPIEVEFVVSDRLISQRLGNSGLLESNPELANSVYEALGFKSKPDVILPIGTSGSGKSTFVKSLPQENLVIIEPDAMRVEFTGDMNDKSKDKEIYEEAAKRAIAAIKQGKQVVFDTTNLTKEKRLPFIEAIKKEIPNANIQYKLMELNPELAKQRIKADIERINNFEPVLKENPVNINAKFPKDQIKANYADGIIAYGTHSTGKYAEAFGGTRTSFKEGEVIMISVNGNSRPNQKENVEKTKRAIDQAISQGVSAFIADNKTVANSSHNSGGEGVIREYLLSKGLIYKDFKGVGLYIVPKQSVTNLSTSDQTINIYAGTNENAELSNFAIRPFTTNVKTPSGEKQYTFQSVEQGFHFHKALIANNPQVAKQILATTDGGQLRRLTNRSNLKMTPEQVKEWDDTSKSIMLNLMYESYVQNPKAAEKLLATGNARITHTQDNTRWKTDFPEVVMTVRDMLREEGFDTQSRITPQQKQQAQQLYSQYLEQNPNGTVEGFKNWVNSNRSNIQYQNQTDLQAEQDAVLEEFANSLSERFNISFDLVSEEDARAMFPEYANEPAFFDPKAKKAYLVKGKANKTSAVHEIFTHPFLLQIEKTNTTLYRNLLKEAKNNKGVVDYVDNLYGTSQNNDHEYIARAIDLAVQGELDQQKDRTLLGRIQEFFNRLSDYLKKLFNIPEVFSSAISPNITLQQLAQFAMYGKGKMNLNPAQENIEYSLKATDIIVKNLDRIRQWEKNKSISEDVLWDKIQKDLRVPKEQIELIKNSEGNTVEEKLLDFTNQYSYTVEINTAKQNKFRYEDAYSEEGEFLGTYPIEDGKTDNPTQYYSHLTVPGGTNYTENAIQTPNIINISIAHISEFAKGIANMIGWFRSDDKTITEKSVNKAAMDAFGLEDENESSILKQVGASKTRRILEVQSDLFQKGKDKDMLIVNPNVKKAIEKGAVGYMDITGKDKKLPENQFLQLLNKDSNWATFFIKSIIQDSAKKGYEKVLFPKGNTVIKIQSAGNYNNIENAKEANETDLVNTAIFYENTITNILKKQGYNPVEITDEYGNTWNEITIDENRDNQNIVFQKAPQPYSFQPLQQPEVNTQVQKVSPATLTKVRNFLTAIGVDVKAVNQVTMNGTALGANGIANPLIGLVQYVQGREDSVLPEEAFHITIEILEQKQPSLVNKLILEASRQPGYREIFNQYADVYTKDGKPDVRKIRKEAAAKFLAEAIAGTESIGTDRPLLLRWWANVVAYLKELFGMVPNNYFQEVAKGILSDDNLGTVRNTLLNNVDYLTQYLPVTKAERIVELAESDISTQELYSEIAKLLNDIEAEVFYQLSSSSQRVDSHPVQKTIVEQIKAEATRTIKIVTPDVNEYRRDGRVVKNRVTDLAKEHYKELFGDTDTRDSRVEFLADYGTQIHADIENIIKRYTDKDGFILTNSAGKVYTTAIADLPNTTKEIYNRLEEYVTGLLQEYVDNPATADVRIMTESVVYDAASDTAGTIDFLAVLPDGKVDILDWKSMNIDTAKNSDIPFYKIPPYRIQLGEYKRILNKNYSVKDFGKTRAIPMNLQLLLARDETPKVIGFQIGNPNPKLESNDYLLPVPTVDESTGIQEIDQLLKKLNALYARIIQGKVAPEERMANIERLNKLYHAMRKLQVQLDITPLLDYIEVLNKEADHLVDMAADLIAQPDNVTDPQLEQFYRSLIDVMHKYGTFEAISAKSIRDMVTPEVRDRILRLVQDLRDYNTKLTDTLKEVSDVHLGKKLGIIGLTIAEKDFDNFMANLRSTDRGGTKALNAFVKLKNPAISASEILQQQRLDKLLEIRKGYMEWAKQKGLGPKNMFDILLQKDKDGKRVNLRLKKIKKEFYEEFQKQKKARNADWFKQNIDMDAFEKWLDNYRAEKRAFFEREIWSADPVENQAKIDERLRKLDEETSLSNYSDGWGHWGMLQFAKDIWHTDEYKELLKPENAPAYQFYTYIQQLTDEALDLGMIQPKVKNTFLPFIKKEGISEKAVFGGTYKVLQGFYDSISVEDYDQGFGVRDEVTGELIREIPVYYTKDFTGKMDMDYISTDLFENIRIFQNHVLKYKALRSIEYRVKALEVLESVKNSLQTDSRGRLIPDQDNLGQFVTKEGNEVNYNLLKEHIDAVIYDRKFEDGAGNKPIFHISPKVDAIHSKINKALGLNILPTNLSGRAVTLNKAVDALNNLFRMRVLGLNIGIPIANYLGGKMQSILNAGTFYSKRELAAAEWKVAYFAFNTEEGKKTLRLIREMDPWVLHDRLHSKSTTVSQISDFDFYRDFLMSPFQVEGRLTQFVHIVAMLENAIVINGEMVNVRKYVKDKYKGTRYTTTSKEQIEKEIKELRESHGVLKLATIKDGKIHIPGLDITSPSVADYRTRIMAATKAFTGSSTSDDITRAERNIWFKSLLVFKSWIVPLVDNRASELKYVPSTDQWEWGRTRSIMRILLHSGMSAAKNIYNVAVRNQEGIDYVNRLLEYKRQEYFEKTGMELSIDSDDFQDMIRNNIKGQMLDLIFITGFTGLLLGAAALAPDDDDKEAQGYYKFAMRILNKAMDELLFYYNPVDFDNIVNGSLFPGLGLVTDIYKIFTNLGKELVGDEETKEGAHPLKYILKLSPITNNLQLYMAVASPDFAKEMGIQISTEARRK